MVWPKACFQKLLISIRKVSDFIDSIVTSSLTSTAAMQPSMQSVVPDLQSS